MCMLTRDIFYCTIHLKTYHSVQYKLYWWFITNTHWGSFYNRRHSPCAPTQHRVCSSPTSSCHPDPPRPGSRGPGYRSPACGSSSRSLCKTSWVKTYKLLFILSYIYLTIHANVDFIRSYTGIRNIYIFTMRKGHRDENTKR